MGGKSAPEYQSTTSTNPYATATATKNGTSIKLNDFLTGTNAWVENNMPSLYDQLLNPSLDSPTIKAKSALFNDEFTEQSNKAFENNLINPLSERNMLRSSAATDMYNSFAKDQNDTLSTFNNQLIADNSADTSNLVNQLMNIYLLGANLGNQAVSTAQQQANQVNNYQLGAYQNANNNNSSMWGNIGSLAGTAAGAYFGGPVGAAVGSKVGSAAGSAIKG